MIHPPGPLHEIQRHESFLAIHVKKIQSQAHSLIILPKQQPLIIINPLQRREGKLLTAQTEMLFNESLPLGHGRPIIKYLPGQLFIKNCIALLQRMQF